MTKVESLFSANHVVVVGASDEPMRVGGRPLQYLRNVGYRGVVSPVNPNRDSVQGIPCYRTIADVPGSPELAIIAVPQPAVMQAVHEAADRGIHAMVIFSAGFADGDGDGALAEKELTRVALERDLAICGPNTLGLMSAPGSLPATFTTCMEGITSLGQSTVALVSQSGALGAFLYGESRRRGFAYSRFVATGNEAVVGAGAYLRYVANDPETRAIGMYIEGIRDGAEFVAGLADARRLGKPVVAMKVGRSSVGQRAAQSHTGAMVGDDAVYDAIFRQYGVRRVDDLTELLDALWMLDRYPTVQEPRNLAVVTLSGGSGVWASDVADAHDVPLAELSAETRSRLSEILPAFASLENPVDVTGQVVNEPALLGRAAGIVAADTSVGCVLVLLGIQEDKGVTIAQGLVEAHRASGVPIIVGWMTPPDDAVDVLREGGITAFDDLGRAMRAAVGRLASSGTSAVGATPEVAAHVDWSLLAENPSEAETLDWFGGMGIPGPRRAVADSADVALSHAQEIGWPVVVKAMIPGVTHKTELGLVRVNVEGEADLRAALHDLDQRGKRLTDGGASAPVLIEEMVGRRYEFLLGFTRDPIFGPMVAFGLGGVTAELVGDISIRRAPLTASDALSMVHETSAVKLLAGFRGSPAMGDDAVVDAILRFADAAASAPSHVSSVEINPLVITLDEARVLALDAVVAYEPSS